MSISGRATIAGVAGWPVGHSLSPRLHGYWLERYGIDGAYVPLAIPPERFETALRSLPDLGFAGCNITVPHKEAAFRVVDETDRAAEKLGAVNTICVLADGKLRGINTDGHGFLENLRQLADGWDAVAGPAVVLGAGGAARAVCTALLDAGAPEVRLVNRTRERAEAVARDIDAAIEVADWSHRSTILRDAALLVNTTSLGMSGQPPLELDLAELPSSALVTDIVYSPLETNLLAAARANGHRTVDGLGMLLHQAAAGFEMWFGVVPEVDDGLRTHMLEAFKEAGSK